MIKAVILDMDGLLIDSEPLWEEAEVEVFNKVAVPLTSEMTKQTMGLRVDEVVQYWFSRFPWESPTQQEVQAEVVAKVIELVKLKGTSRNGVKELVEFFRGKNIPLAIASSSQMEIINAVLDKLAIRDSLSVICSAEHEPYGKPHPGVYITAAEKLEVQPEHCLAFEDSPNGVLSAKAAKMKCVAVPDEKMKDDKRFCIADLMINRLTEFDEEKYKTFL
ncbi:MAG: hexitol phosphatase HxpB [Candidatus Levybacteria bacterium]|nr:hexitol phosphatase HxpB [Candidatus Levybacteria bacterium]